MGEWLLSRRDRLIVARHEVPGLAMQRAPVPEGRSKSWPVPEIFVVETEVHDALETLGIPVERYVGF